MSHVSSEFKTVIVLIVVVFLPFVVSQSTAQETPLSIDNIEIVTGKEQVKWKKQIGEAQNFRIADVVATEDGWLLAITKKNVPLVVKLDNEGNQVWQKEFRDLALAGDGKTVFSMTFLSSDAENDEKSIRLCLCGRDAVILHLDSDGRKTDQAVVYIAGEIHGVNELRNGDLLFFGSNGHQFRKRGNGRVTRTNSKGVVRWSKAFTPETKDEFFDLEDAPPKMIHVAGFDRAIELSDSTITFVGQTGYYGKFGTGFSKLWLLKLKPDGERITESFVEESYSNSLSYLPIHASDSAIMVHHWKAVGEGNDKRLYPWQSRFDHDLNPTSDFDLTKQLPRNSRIAGSSASAILPMFFARLPVGSEMIRWSDEHGREMQRVEIESEHGALSSALAICSGEDALWVVHWNELDPKDSSMLLFMLKTPHQKQE